HVQLNEAVAGNVEGPNLIGVGHWCAPRRSDRHQACTQCLGALEGRDWLMAVAPPGGAPMPDPNEIRAFHIPGNCFIKLHVGTWHAGPYFEGDPISFYNLELSDTNIVDHDTCNLAQNHGLRFRMSI
ncbi:MAG: ureidoglycolate lyase, partial [Cyanobacteria bacterium J06626_23]